MGYHVFLTNKEWGAGVPYNPNQNGVKGILADGISPKRCPTREDRQRFWRVSEDKWILTTSPLPRSIVCSTEEDDEGVGILEESKVLRFRFLSFSGSPVSKPDLGLGKKKEAKEEAVSIPLAQWKENSCPGSASSMVDTPPPQRQSRKSAANLRNSPWFRSGGGCCFEESPNFALKFYLCLVLLPQRLTTLSACMPFFWAWFSILPIIRHLHNEFFFFLS